MRGERLTAKSTRAPRYKKEAAATENTDQRNLLARKSSRSLLTLQAFTLESHPRPLGDNDVLIINEKTKRRLPFPTCRENKKKTPCSGNRLICLGCCGAHRTAREWMHVAFILSYVADVMCTAMLFDGCYMRLDGKRSLATS